MQILIADSKYLVKLDGSQEYFSACEPLFPLTDT